MWAVLQGGWASGGGAGPAASSPGALGDGLMSPRGTAGFVDGLLGMGKAGAGEGEGVAGLVCCLTVCGDSPKVLPDLYGTRMAVVQTNQADVTAMLLAVYTRACYNTTCVC
jgi:hypothetical protein